MKFTPSGDLDPTFSGDGIAVLDIDGKEQDFYSVEAVPGGVIVAGFHDFDPVAVRVTDAGVLDTTFGTGGIADLGLFATWYPDSLAVDVTGGRIAVVGQTSSPGPKFGVRVLRLSDGQPDPTFNGGALGEIFFPGDFYEPSGVAIDSDGRISVGARMSSSTLGVARFDADGTTDTTFGTDGVFTWPAGGSARYWPGVTLDVDGDDRILAAAQVHTPTPNVAVSRLTEDGLDTSFGADGTAMIPVSGLLHAAGLVASPAGVTVGASNGTLRAARLVNTTVNGPADTTDPTATITTPADGASYATGSTVTADYSCDDDTGVATCVGTVADGGTIDTSTPGSYTFQVTATDTAGNTTVEEVTYSVQIQAAQNVPPGGSVTAGDDDDPYQVTVESPSGGDVAIVVELDAADPPDGYEVLGVAIDITAPPGSAGAPLQLTFRVDQSLFDDPNPDITWQQVQVLRDGVALAPCTVSPVPCVFSHTEAPDGDAVLVIHTDHASLWQTVARTAFDVTGFLSPVVPPPGLNPVKAGTSVPLRFSLDGYQGLNVIAAGSPASRTVSCTTRADLGPLQPTLNAGGSVLTYNGDLDAYTYVWKTQKQWASTCRKVVVMLADATTLEAIFEFKK